MGYVPVEQTESVIVILIQSAPLVGEGKLDGCWDVPGDSRIDVPEDVTVMGRAVVSGPAVDMRVLVFGLPGQRDQRLEPRTNPLTTRIKTSDPTLEGEPSVTLVGHSPPLCFCPG
jgi:hypothetical protein